MVLGGPGLALALAARLWPNRVPATAVLGVLSFVAYLGVLFRCPIYTAVCLFVTAGTAAHLSLPAILLCVLIWASSFARMLCEEQLLRVRYPEYRKYAASTARMIPLVF